MLLEALCGFWLFSADRPSRRVTSQGLGHLRRSPMIPKPLSIFIYLFSLGTTFHRRLQDPFLALRWSLCPRFVAFAWWQSRSSVQSQTYQREFADLDIELKNICICDSSVLSWAASVALEVNLQPVPLQLHVGVAAVVHLIYTWQRRCQRPYKDLQWEWVYQGFIVKWYLEKYSLF